MELNRVIKARPLLLTMFITIFCAFWLWIIVISNFSIVTKGWTGNLTLILDGLYVLGVPLLGVVTISIACLAVFKRSAPLGNVMIIVLVAAALAFWAWSLSPSGQFDLRWTK
jgi:hypothetical protein